MKSVFFLFSGEGCPWMSTPPVMIGVVLAQYFDGRTGEVGAGLKPDRTN